MALSMYQASVPVFIRMLENLANLLDKGAKHAEAKGFDPSALIQARLYPDMFAFARQIQIAADGAKAGAARLAGQEPPKYEDNETTFPELIARVRKTIEFLKTFKPEQIDGSENREITLQMRAGSVKMTGQEFLLNTTLPNFFFHITTAYDLLRHNGVEIGKRDYLGNR